MSLQRARPDRGRVDVRSLATGVHGRPLCRLCSREVPWDRRTFCSDSCVHRWRLQSDPGYARRQVARRDRGICALCSLDTERLRRERDIAQGNQETWTLWCQRFAALGYPARDRSRAFWQADHVVPVIEGGGGCGLDNLRTLCTPCHLRATADLAARRAAVINP